MLVLTHTSFKSLVPQGSQFLGMKEDAPSIQILKIKFTVIIQQQKSRLHNGLVRDPLVLLTTAKKSRRNWSFRLTVTSAEKKAILSSVNRAHVFLK